MTRRLYNIAVITSLVLFVVVMGLWVASGFYNVFVVFDDPIGDGYVTAGQRPGYMFSGWLSSRYYGFDERIIIDWRSNFTMIPPRGLDRNMWFGLGYQWEYSIKSFEVPHWLLAILTAILPVVWLIRRRRKRDPDAVPCAKCGYDLRGSPGGACPECGAG